MLFPEPTATGCITTGRNSENHRSESQTSNPSASNLVRRLLDGGRALSLGIVLQEESQRQLKDWSVEILATDLNERSLAHAKNALYGNYSTRHLSQYQRQKYFSPVGDQLQLEASVRNSVNFSRLNLSDDARMTFMKSLDVVFCCNVLIYFDLASKRRVIQHFYNNLLPHGYLFLGHSESLYGVNDDFKLVHLPGATAYIKGDRVQVGRW